MTKRRPVQRDSRKFALLGDALVGAVHASRMMRPQELSLVWPNIQCHGISDPLNDLPLCFGIGYSTRRCRRMGNAVSVE